MAIALTYGQGKPTSVTLLLDLEGEESLAGDLDLTGEALRRPLYLSC